LFGVVDGWAFDGFWWWRGISGALGRVVIGVGYAVVTREEG